MKSKHKAWDYTTAEKGFGLHPECSPRRAEGLLVFTAQRRDIFELHRLKKGTWKPAREQTPECFARSGTWDSTALTPFSAGLGGELYPTKDDGIFSLFPSLQIQGLSGGLSHSRHTPVAWLTKMGYQSPEKKETRWQRLHPTQAAGTRCRWYD